MSQVQSYGGLVAYFHRKDCAIKTNMVGRRTQSHVLTSLIELSQIIQEYSFFAADAMG